ncbi:MAG: glycosyltransferase family 39 protein [Candidatus Omnitrophica bacterium]|nr:glycosyltransferase family 39 protein [Candidatus Omnitrophota bacterium]
MSSSVTNSRILLFLILVLGFALRITGIQFGLPHLYHADEPIVINHALAYGMGDLNPHFFKIPPAISYLVFLAFGVYYLIGAAVGFFHSLQDFELLFYRDPSSFYLIARLVFGVLTGTFTIYALYKLVKTHFGESHGLVAAFLLSVCFLHVRDSHYVYPDIPLILVLVVAFFPIWRLIDKGNRFYEHFLCGIMIGLATAIKYNGIALAIPYAVATLLAVHKRRIFSGFVAGMITAFFTFVALNPYSMSDFPTFWNEISTQARSHGFVGWFHHFQYSLQGALGLSLYLTAIAGLLLFRRYERKRLILLSFIIFYYFLITFQGQPYDRYVLPLLPFLIFFAADFLWLTANRLKQYGRPVLLGMTLIIAAEPLYASILFDRIMLAKDTRTLAKEWVESHIPDGEAIALDWEFYAPRLGFSEKQLTEKKKIAGQTPHFSEAQTRRLDFLLNHPVHPAYDLYFLKENPEERRLFLFAQPTIAYNIERLRETGIHYVITVTSDWKADAARQAFDEKLSQSAVLLAEFSPYRNRNFNYSFDPQPLTGGPFLLSELMARDRNGLTIRVYQLA